MNADKIEEIITALLGCIFALLLCGLAAWMSYQEMTSTTTYFFCGITARQKVLAALFAWFGLVLLFFSVKKLITIRSVPGK